MGEVTLLTDNRKLWHYNWAHKDYSKLAMILHQRKSWLRGEKKMSSCFIKYVVWTEKISKLFKQWKYNKVMPVYKPLGIHSIWLLSRWAHRRTRSHWTCSGWQGGQHGSSLDHIRISPLCHSSAHHHSALLAWHMVFQVEQGTGMLWKRIWIMMFSLSLTRYLW